MRMPYQLKQHLDAAIRAAGTRRDINEVIRIFQSLGDQADVYTYTAVITAMSDNNRIDLAEEAFRIAQAYGQVNSVTIGNINDVRQKNALPSTGACFRHNPYSFTNSWVIIDSRSDVTESSNVSSDQRVAQPTIHANNSVFSGSSATP